MCYNTFKRIRKFLIPKEFNMTFGQRLKKLRREYDMTQERLAELLGVTPQAVSRWETDAVMPDITLLPTFANLFHVTTDYLLNVDITKQDDRIREIKERAWTEYNKFTEKYSQREQHECIHSAVKVIEEGLKLYPDSWVLKEELMRFRICWYDEDIDVLRENQREIVRLSEDVLANCTNERLRRTAVYNICQFSRIFGLTERAKEITAEMPTMSMSQEMLKLNYLEGEELRQMNLWMIGIFLQNISSCIFSLTNDPDMPSDEIIELERRSKELFSVMYGGDDFSTICNPWFSAWELAEKIASRGDFDNAFLLLDKEYERMIKLSENEYKNISPYVHPAHFGMNYLNMTKEQWREHFLWRIDNDWLDFIEKSYPKEFTSDPRYEKLVEKLRAYRKKYSK